MDKKMTCRQDVDSDVIQKIWSKLKKIKNKDKNVFRQDFYENEIHKDEYNKCTRYGWNIFSADDDILYAVNNNFKLKTQKINLDFDELRKIVFGNQIVQAQIFTGKSTPILYDDEEHEEHEEHEKNVELANNINNMLKNQRYKEVGWNDFFEKIVTGSIDDVKKMIDDNEQNIYCITENGTTPLIVASDCGKCDIVDLLLRLSHKKPYVHHKDKFNKTAIDYASSKGYLRCVLLLMNAGSIENMVYVDDALSTEYYLKIFSSEELTGYLTNTLLHVSAEH